MNNGYLWVSVTFKVQQRLDSNNKPAFRKSPLWEGRFMVISINLPWGKYIGFRINVLV